MESLEPFPAASEPTCRCRFQQIELESDRDRGISRESVNHNHKPRRRNAAERAVASFDPRAKICRPKTVLRSRCEVSTASTIVTHTPPAARGLKGSAGGIQVLMETASQLTA
jgi:hypothetical protein